MSDQSTDATLSILRAVGADLAEIKAEVTWIKTAMATKADVLALHREIMTLRSALVADIRSEFSILHSRLDMMERTR